MKTATCKKLFALLLGLIMCLGASSALAEEIVVPTLRAVPSDADMLPGNDELYEAYLYREVCDPAHGGISFFSRLARGQLGDPEGHVYDALKPLIEKVAAGERTDTQFKVPVSDMPEGYQSSFTFEELGITQSSLMRRLKKYNLTSETGMNEKKNMF